MMFYALDVAAPGEIVLSVLEENPVKIILALVVTLVAAVCVVSACVIKKRNSGMKKAESSAKEE